MRSFSPRGMTLIDVLIGTGIVLIIFVSIAGILRASVQVSAFAKLKTTATSIASSQMEYIRSLPYDSVGTVGGIPSGVVPQYATTTTAGIDFVVRTYVQYVDDPKDGLGAADTNGITTDYKNIKVTTTYRINGVQKELTLVSNQAPLGIETTNGGGTLMVTVVNSSGAKVSGATVRIVNTVVSPSVDLTTFSDSNGIVYLPGALPSSEYQVYVSKSGYSSSQTYARDATNANPTPGYLTVAAGQTTGSTFAIDLLATLTLKTYSPIAAGVWDDFFNDLSKLSSLSGTQVIGSALTLSGSVGSYGGSGTATSIVVSPQYLVSWTSASSTIPVISGTTARIAVTDSAGTLLPDTVVPGNSAGFTGTIDLSGVSTTTYPSLRLVATLTSSDPALTPSISDWELGYTAGPTPLGSVPFTLRGAKTTGSTSGGSTIYKTTISSTTNSIGIFTQSLEWDSYAFSPTGYDIVDTCSLPPFAVSPGASQTVNLVVIPSSSDALLVAVYDSTGSPVSGVTVTLSKTGFSDTKTSSSCGTAYFGGLTAASTYSVMIQKTGYTTTTFSNVSISSFTTYAASFP